VLEVTIGDQNNWIWKTLTTTDHDLDSLSSWLKEHIEFMLHFVYLVNCLQIASYTGNNKF